MSRLKAIPPGTPFGSLTTTGVVTRTYRVMWECRCVCGNITYVCGQQLRAGTSSCKGCVSRRRMTTHGQTGTKLHKIWRSMISRCENPKSPSYKYYGAKGIAVCSSWRKSFEAFATDMHGFRLGLSIDRIDSSGNYEPGNCRWATPTEQARNQKNNVLVEFNGRSMSMAEAAEIANLPYSAVSQRIRKLKWTTERALSTPVRVVRHA